MTLTHQLLLALEKSTLASFESFYPAGNQLCYNTLSTLPLKDRMIYLEGPEGVGKTHLCEALAAKLLEQGKNVIFLSGKDAPNPQLFYDLPPIDCLILDDLDHLLAFSLQYEEALFSLYNQIYDRHNAILIVTASCPISQLSLSLSDLRSRLQAMLPLSLIYPPREAFYEILNLHSNRLQIKINQPILEYLTHSLPLNPKIQIDILKRLAEQSLRDKKPLNLAYVQRLLSL